MMVWIINSFTNKVQQVGLGSTEMLAASNVWMTQEEAIRAHRESCSHPTRLGNSKTGVISCADCNARLN